MPLNVPPLNTYETVCYEALNPYQPGKKFDWKLKLYPEETLAPGEMFVFSKYKEQKQALELLQP